jgi:beta propeller repeat protein/parallel beta-helix repeat protein
MKLLCNFVVLTGKDVIMRKSILLSLALLSIAVTQSLAGTLSVPGDYPTIQQAIQASSDGDVVVVEPGTYFETIDFLGRNITVTSTDPDDPDVVAATVIDGDGEGSVVTFNSGETSEAVLTGFTIRNGYGTVVSEVGNEILWGGGIFCYGSSPTVKSNIIINNHGPVEINNQGMVISGSYGAGIGCFVSSAIITNNIIKNNSGFAGAVFVLGDDKICNNLIYDNSALVGGGVILFGGLLINNTIVGNDTNVIQGGGGSGGNIYIVSDNEFSYSLMILNNIICNAKSGGGISGEGNIDTSVISYNDVWGNVGGNYQQISDQTGINGNISEDPLLVDARAKDFHLQMDSPCIDAGDPDYVPFPWQLDIDGENAAMGEQIDIGADEYVGYIKPVADAGPDIHVPGLELVTLDASGSYQYDPNNELIYEWDQLEGAAVDLDDPISMHPSFMPGVEGEYRFELVVWDGTHLSRPDEVFILVGNEAPVADAGLDRVSPVPSQVNLNGTGSYDPDKIDELTYSWKQLEGPQIDLQNADAARPFFDCNEQGTYAFELVVSDGFVDSEPSITRVTTVAVTMVQNSLNAGYVTDDYFYYADVSGNKVVYCVGPLENYTWDIKTKDLVTEEINEAFFGGGLDTQPKINGDIVVWAGGPTAPDFFGTENISIFATNTATGAQKILRQHSNSESYSHPAVSGNKVVWLEHRNINKYSEIEWLNMPYSIAGADVTDLDNPVYFTIEENVGRRDPYAYENYMEDFDDVVDISENIVVWEAGGDIFGADISNIDSISTFTICSNPARQYDPAISGNLVVWTDERNDGGDIYGADISDMDNIREMAIIKSPGEQLQPDVDGCLIAYVNGGNAGGIISVCCLTKEKGVMDVELQQFFLGVGPAIDSDTIVWQTGTFGEVQAISLEFGYAADDGPIENVNTGEHYDYIQHAIVRGNPGDKIVVAEGTYHEDIDFMGRNLTVSSTNPDDPTVVAATIIDGDSRAVTFANGETADCILSGFTLTGGSRGIYGTNNSLPTIDKCTITGNTGSGIELYKGGNPTLKNCSIIANGGSGVEMRPLKAGRYTYYNSPVLTNCIVAKNNGYGLLKGIPTITNCTIAGNRNNGIKDSFATVTNSIVYFNSDGSAQIVNNTGSVNYSNIQSSGLLTEGSYEGAGNIDDDPLFADMENGDYHLKSHIGRWDPAGETWISDALTSLCLDAGDPASPIGLEPEPNGGIINMGAYGGTAQASKSAIGND